MSDARNESAFGDELCPGAVARLVAGREEKQL
jgi:hypothetical protein